MTVQYEVHSDFVNDVHEFDIDIDGWTTHATYHQTHVSINLGDVMDGMEHKVTAEEIIICRINEGQWDVIA